MAWLSAGALRPWKHRSWIFQRDPDFAANAGPILDLYGRVWDGVPLSVDDYVISADEKPSIQARRRKHPTLPVARNRPARVEHEYLTAGRLDLRGGPGCPSRKGVRPVRNENGIAPVDRLVSELMPQEPYKSARRVFWIMENCSADRGQKAAGLFRDKWPNAILIHFKWTFTREHLHALSIRSPANDCPSPPDQNIRQP